jgi:hypothetical protein
VVNLLKAKLSKMGTSDTYSLYVWELQERGALHLHYALVITDSVVRRAVIEEFPRMWRQCIDAVGRLAGVDMWARKRGGTWADRKEVLQADAQECEKSPDRYLAKYCSKDAFASRHRPVSDRNFKGPVRWWGVSRPLLRELKKMSLKVVAIGVPWRNIAQIKEDILTILDGLSAKIQRYTDKAKSAEVFVAYDEENGMEVFGEIARRLGIPPRNHCGDLRDVALGDRSGKNHDAAKDLAVQSAGLAVNHEASGEHGQGGEGHAGICSGNPGEMGLPPYQMDIW